MYRLTANGMRSGGCAGFGGCCVHGDMGSDRSTQQNTSVANQQVSQSGRGQLGISGSTVANSQISVIDGDVQVARDAIELAHQGINGAAVSALSANDLAKNVVALSQGTVTQALKTLEVAQNRALQTTDEAVQAAQQTAKNSTAIPQSALSEKITTQVLVAAVISIGLVVYVSRKS
jgi:hypothetical protein